MPENDVVAVYSNAAYCPSGYGTQTLMLMRQLAKNGWTPANFAFHGLHGVPLAWDSFQIYPGSGEDAFAQDLLPAHYQHARADLLITLMDAWVLDPAKLQGMNVAHWLPVDCSPLSVMDRKVLDAGGGKPIAISRFGERMLREAGYDPYYAPHALDTQVWAPLPERDTARDQLGLAGKFVVGINSANQDPFRKGFSEQMEAFANVAATRDDMRLLIHSRAETRNGVNLISLIRDLNLGDKAMLGDQYQIAAGMVGEQQMVTWHSICDLGINFSWGEGFGLAGLQFQACGVPVGLSDNSTGPELCGAGWLARGQRTRNRGHDAFWHVPFIHDIERCLAEAHGQWKDDPDGWQALRDKARDFALGYDADKVFAECWAPILRDLIPESAPPQVTLPGTTTTTAVQVNDGPKALESAGA